MRVREVMATGGSSGATVVSSRSSSPAEIAVDRMMTDPKCFRMEFDCASDLNRVRCSREPTSARAADLCLQREVTAPEIKAARGGRREIRPHPGAAREGPRPVQEDLLERLDGVAEMVGLSRNQCIVDSVECHLRALKRRLVDQAFLAMADDPEYLAEMAAMEAEMAHLSDEAWLVMERVERSYGKAEPPSRSSRPSKG